MDKTAKDFEKCLSVGLRFIFYPDPGESSGRRYKTCLRGWHALHYLSVDRPKVNDRLVALREHQTCIVRFLFEGQACGFDTMVLGWDTGKSNPQLRLAWPREFQLVSIRKHERIRIQIPGTIELPDGVSSPAEVLDLSEGGCGLCTMASVTLKSTVKLSFTLPDGSLIDRIGALVCSVAPSGQGNLVGCRFLTGQQGFTSDIRFYILAALGHMRGHAGSGRRIVVMEEDLENPGDVCIALDEKGYEVVHAGGLVDAFYRLRMVQPAALVLHWKQQELAWDEVCRIVKHTQGMKDLPIFLFAKDAPGLQQKVVDAGVTAYFDSPEALAGSISSYMPAAADPNS